LVALRHRYTTVGTRDYPETVVADMLRAIQALLRDSPPPVIAQILVDHLEQVIAHREGASAEAIRKFRQRIQGETMSTRFKKAWTSLDKDVKTRRPTPDGSSSNGWRRRQPGSGGAGGGKASGLYVAPEKWAKLSPEEREALKKLREKVK
jgi:hypothetical protein